MTESLPLLMTATAGAFCAGFMFSLRPSQWLNATERPRGLDAAVAALAIPCMLLAGIVTDTWGAGTVLMLGSCLAALACVGFDRGVSLMPTFGAAALLAAATSALFVGSVVLMPRVFFPEHSARSENLGFIAIALGGLAGGGLAHTFARTENRKALLILAVTALLPAVCVIFTPAAAFGESSSGEMGKLFTDPLIGLILAMTALCFPLDAMLGPWARRYAREHSHHKVNMAVMVVGFWLALLGTRLFAGFALPTGWEHVWILMFAIFMVIIFSNMLGAYAPASNYVGLWLTAACCAPFVPTLLGLTLHHHPECPGAAVGLTGAAGMLGILLASPLLDTSRPDRPSRNALRGAVALALLLLVPALVLAVLGESPLTEVSNALPLFRRK